MTFEDTRAEGGGCGGGTTARKHAAHANDGGGLLGIRSLVRRRPPSVPRGGGGNAAGNSAAPARPGGSSAVPVPRQRSRLQQQERYSQQKEQQHHQQPRGPSTNTSARAGPSKRRITGYGGPGDHEQRRAPSSSHQSHEHLRRAPRPRTRPLSQPRGMLTTSGTLATGGMSAGQQQRSAQRPRHGTPTSRSDAARSGRSLAVGTGAGVGVGVGGDARRPIGNGANGGPTTTITGARRRHDAATLQKMREESRRRMGFDTAGTAKVLPSRRSLATPGTGTSAAGGRGHVRRRPARPLLQQQKQRPHTVDDHAGIPSNSDSAVAPTARIGADEPFANEVIRPQPSASADQGDNGEERPLRDENQRQGSGSIIVLTKPSGTAGSRRASRGTNPPPAPTPPRVGGDKDLSSHRSSSSNSKLSSYSAVSSASKAREGQLETVRQQSLRSAHFMPTISSAKLHVVAEVDSKVERSSTSASASASNSAALVSTSAASASSRSLHTSIKTALPITGAGANTAAVASSSKSMTDMFNWSSSSLEKDTDDLFKDDRLAESFAATGAEGDIHGKETEMDSEPLSNPGPGIEKKTSSLFAGKRGSIHTHTSHSTAPVDNLASSSSNFVNVQVQHKAADQSVDELTQEQTNVVQPPPPPSIPGAPHQPRLSNDTEYLRFATAAGGSSRKLVDADVASSGEVASTIPTEVDGEPAATSTVSSESSTTSSEFLRFRSEAAGFGKRVLIADAVAALDERAEDNGNEGNHHPESQSQATMPSTMGHGTATSGTGDGLSAALERQDKAMPSVAVRPPQQLRSAHRMTDTTCTQADDNDSFFRAEKLRAPASLDVHISQTRPPRTVGPRQHSKGSSISSLTRPLEKPVPPYQKVGRMGRLLRKKKKKKANDKNHRHASGALPPRGLPSKGDSTGSRPRLSTVLSERIVTALSGSITSFSSKRNLVGSTERRRSFSDAQLIAAIPRPSEIEDVRSEGGPMHLQPIPVHSDSGVSATKPIEGEEPSGATDIAPDAQSEHSEDSSADLRKGDDMMLRWKQLGVDIATKQLDAAGDYYEKGDLLRARACYAQVAAMDRPLDGDADDATVVLSGLFGEAKSMLVRIDSARSLQSNDPPSQAPTTDAPIAVPNAAANDDQGAPGQNDDGRSAATDPTNEDDIFASVHKAFFSDHAEHESDGPASAPITSAPPQQPMAQAATIQSVNLDNLLQEGVGMSATEDPETRSAYSAKDIENMANDLVSLRSRGADSSKRSSVASIDMVDSINLADITKLEEDGDDNAWVSTETTSSPPESSMTTSVGTGTSDQVAVNGQRIKDVDTNLPTAVALLQEAGAPYTIPTAPPSNRGLLASDSTLSASLNVTPHLHAQQQIVESDSQQLAGSDTSEVASRSSSRSESVLEPPHPAVGEACPVEIIPAVHDAAEMVAATQDDKGTHIPTGEDTNEPPQRQSSAEALAQSAAHDRLEQDAADADEPVIYLRHNSSGISVVSDMIESTASSWLKMQASNPSRENSTSSKGDGTNPSLTIVGEELVIEDGLDPTEALKRATEQERLVADQQLEEQVDAIEREAAEAARRKEEKKTRRNTKDSMRLHDQGMVYYNQGDFEGARSCFASALKMRFQLHGQSSLDTCLTQEKLGDTLVKLDKIEEAHWQYLMAFRGLQQCNLPKDNPHTARILVSLGDVFFSAADYSRALKYYEKSIRFHAETNSDDVCGGLMKCALANESMAKNDWVKGEVDMCRFHVRELLWLLTYESPAARALFETKGAVKRQRVIANGFVSIPALRSSRCLRQVRATKTRRSHISKSRRLCSFARDPLRPTWTFSVF